MGVPAARSLHIKETASRLTLTLDRPERRNALDGAVLEELAAALRSSLDRGGGVVHLRAAGTVFCAGADLSILKTTADPAERKRIFAPHAGAIAEGIGTVVKLLHDTRLVTVAEIPGPAIGGGWVLAMGFDFRIASHAARFWFPEIELGRVAGSASVALMTELAGPIVAREMFMLARRFEAPELLSRGLLTELALPDGLASAADAFCTRLEVYDSTMLARLKQRILGGGAWHGLSWRE